MLLQVYRCGSYSLSNYSSIYDLDIRGPALYGTPLIGSENISDPVSSCKLPVIVFSHGYGDFRTSCTALNCDLASHGYVMACVEHRDRTAGVTVRKIPKPGAPGEYEDEWISSVSDEDEKNWS